MSAPPASILHVLPADLARGAQVFARTLRDALDGRPHRHRTLALFASGPGGLRPDLALEVPTRRSRSFGLQPSAVVALRRAMADMAPDVVVAHGGEALKYVVAAGRAGQVLIYTKTGVSSGTLRGARHLDLYRLLARRATMVVGVSEESVREATDLLGVHPERVRLIVNGRDPQVYRPAPPALSAAVPKVLFLGHLTATKDPHRFVEVVRRVRERGVALSAVIAGDGPLLGSLRALGAKEGIEVLGRLDDVVAELASAAVLVFPGRPEGEGMPGVFIEAGMCAVPVVTTDVPGAATVIDHGRTGLVVPIDDLTALEDGVVGLLGDARLRSRMGAEARRRCIEHWSLDAVAARWQAAFDEVLGPRAAAGASASTGGAPW